MNFPLRVNGKKESEKMTVICIKPQKNNENRMLEFCSTDIDIGKGRHITKIIIQRKSGLFDYFQIDETNL